MALLLGPGGALSSTKEGNCLAEPPKCRPHPTTELIMLSGASKESPTIKKKKKICLEREKSHLKQEEAWKRHLFPNLPPRWRATPSGPMAKRWGVGKGLGRDQQTPASLIAPGPSVPRSSKRTGKGHRAHYHHPSVKPMELFHAAQLIT